VKQRFTDILYNLQKLKCILLHFNRHLTIEKFHSCNDRFYLICSRCLTVFLAEGDIRYDWGENGMDAHPKGDYVSIEDYQNEVDELKEEADKLRATIESDIDEINELKEHISNLQKEMNL
jgi:hypothetical protein